MWTHYFTIVIKTVWYWQRDRHTDHWNDIQNPRIDSHKYAQFLTKRKEQFNGGKNSLFNKQYWSTWIPTCRQKTNKKESQLKETSLLKQTPTQEQIPDLHVKYRIIKLSWRKSRGKSSWRSSGKEFLDSKPQALSITGKTD